MVDILTGIKLLEGLWPQQQLEAEELNDVQQKIQITATLKLLCLMKMNTDHIAVETVL